MAGVTQQQLDGLAARLDKNFDEIKGLFRAFDERIRNVETTQASCQPSLALQVAALQDRQLAHEQQLVALRGAFEQQQTSLALLGETVNTQKETVQALNNALPEMAQYVKTINVGTKWLGGILATLVSAGLLFIIGRLIYMAIAGGQP